jgi:hypothetical protein
MRTIIAGSRNISELFCPNGSDPCYYGCDCKDKAYAHICRVISIECPWDITTVISGTAMGVDVMGERWAQEHNIPIERYPANWKKHGKSAGPIRNKEMSMVADACLVIYDGNSRGSANMIKTAKEKEIGLMINIPTGLST